MDWIYILTGIPVFLYILWKLFDIYTSSNNDYWTKRGVPRALASEIPGSWKAMIGQKPLHDVDSAYYNKYPDAPYVGIMEWRTPLLIPRDPELVKKITVKDFDHFVNRKIFSFGGDLGDHFLFNMSGALWKSMRSAMTPTFTSGKMRRMFEHFEKSSNEFANFVEKQNQGNKDREKEIVFETREAFGRFTMDVIGSTAFGIDSQCLVNEKSPFYEQGSLLQTVNFFRGLKLFCVMLMPTLSKILGIDFFPKKPCQFFSNIVRRVLADRREQYDKVKNGESKNGVPSDFLQLLVEAQNKDLKEENEEDSLADFERDAKVQNAKNEEITDKFIIGNSFGFFIAGFDNTEAILSAAAYHLAVNPEYQERMREEVDRFVAEYNGKVTYDGVVKMTYMDMFVSECLRLYSPVIRLIRKVNKEYKIPKTGDYPEVTLPVGSLVSFPVIAFHMDPKHWPNPHVFDPERFNAENKAKRHPYVYMPFGLGPRSCIAMRFVLTEIKAAVASLVHRFEIQTCAETTIPMKLQDLQGQHRPAAGLKLALVKRN